MKEERSIGKTPKDFASLLKLCIACRRLYHKLVRVKSANDYCEAEIRSILLHIFLTGIVNDPQTGVESLMEILPRNFASRNIADIAER